MRSLAWAAVALLLLPPATSRSQEPGAKPGSPPVPGVALPQVADTLPPTDDAGRPVDIIYVPNKDGKLIPVARATFEELIRAFERRRAEQGETEAPRFRLTEYRIRGVVPAKQRFAEVEVEVAAELLSTRPLRIPLGLNEALLVESSSGRAEQPNIVPGESGQGYDWIVQAEETGTQRIKFSILVPLSTSGREMLLRLYIPPRDGMQTAFELEVPIAKADSRASEPVVIMPSQPVGPQSTLLRGARMKGDFELAWWTSDTPQPRVTAALEATGQVKVTVDGAEVVARARVQISSTGSEFSEFGVRLPPGMELISTSDAEYRLSAGGEDNLKRRGRLIHVTMPQPTTGPVNVELVARRSQSRSLNRESMELGGFEVMEAVSQRGHLAVVTDDDWQVDWGKLSNNVRRSVAVPPALQDADLDARFEYLSQPFSLPVQLSRRGTRIRVEPEYVLDIDTREARLTALLRYKVRGKKAVHVELQMRGWEWLDVEHQGDLVQEEKVHEKPSGELYIPLRQAVSDFELTLHARRKLPGQETASAKAEKNPGAGTKQKTENDEEAAKEEGGSTTLSLPLPTPLAESIVPGKLALLAADNVELNVDLDGSAGLRRQQAPVAVPLPQRQQEPVYFQVEPGTDEGASPRLVTEATVRSQEVDVDVVSHIEVEAEHVAVEQRLRYRIRYEPIDRVELVAPLEVLSEGELEVELVGSDLQPAVLRDADESNESPTRVSIPLPEGRIGEMTLMARYTLPHQPLAAKQTTVRRVPLLMPADGKGSVIGRNQVEVLAKRPLEVECHAESWLLESESSTEGSGLILQASVPQASVPLAMSLAQSDTPSSTVIDRAWIQTLISGDIRQDVASFRFTSNARQLRLSLPGGIDGGRVEASVDGQFVPVQREGDAYVIGIRPDVAGPRRLQVRYRIPQSGESEYHKQLETPWISGAGRTSELFWELILPHREHLVTTPIGMTPWYRWQFGGGFVKRDALLDHEYLESWIGIEGESDVRGRENRYVFSSLYTPPVIQVYTAPRIWIALGAAIPTVCLALLVVYSAAARRSWFLVFSVVAGLLTLGAWEPEFAWLLAQGALLGVAIGAAAWLLRLWLTVPLPPERPVASPSSLVVGLRQSTESYIPGSPGGDRSSQQTTIALQGVEANE